MNARKSIVLLTGLILWASPFAVFAQAPAGDVRADLASALRVIRPMVRDDPSRAAQMLRNLETQYPTSAHILILLGEAYQVSGQADSARAAYRRCLKHHPAHVQAGAALGTLYVKSGQSEKAEAVFRDMLDKTAYSVSGYRIIGSALARQGYYDRALQMYGEGRERNDNNYILTLDIAYLQRSMGNYEGAMAEYLRLLATASRQHRLARTKILELMRDTNANTDELIAQMHKDADRAGPERGRVLAILAITYLERGMLENALEMALLADDPLSPNGGVLFDLADQTINAYRRQPQSQKTRYFELALRALDAYIDKFPQDAKVPQAKLLMTDLLVDLASGRVQGHPAIELEIAVARTLETLDWLIESYPGTDYAEQAYLKKGEVVFQLLKEPQRALEIYQAGMKNARFYPSLFAERLGRVFLVLDRYDEARELFNGLIHSTKADLREAGVYYTGMLLSFERQYEAARDTLSSLADANPSSPYANDAIGLAWIIEEGLQGEQANLRRFIDALKSEVAGDTATVINALQKITALPADTPLRSRALIMLGDAYDGVGRHEDAVASYERFVDDYAKDTQVPDVYRKIGRVYEVGYGDINLALKKYEDILVSFPFYIFLDEVREDVTRLRASMRDIQ